VSDVVRSGICQWGVLSSLTSADIGSAKQSSISVWGRLTTWSGSYYRCGACGWRQLVPRAERHADVVCERCLKSRISPFAGKCSVAVRSVGMQRGLFLAIAVNFVYDCW